MKLANSIMPLRQSQRKQSHAERLASEAIVLPQAEECLSINAIVFGGCLALFAFGAGTGPGTLLLIGTGLCTLTGFAGIFVTKQALRRKAERDKDS